LVYNLNTSFLRRFEAPAGSRQKRRRNQEMIPKSVQEYFFSSSSNEKVFVFTVYEQMRI